MRVSLIWRNPRVFKLLGLLFLSALTACPLTATDNPVKVSASIQEADKKSSECTVNLLVSIQPGWHLYDAVPKDGSASRTTVELETPKGVETVGDVVRPISLPYVKKPGARVFQVTAVFSQKLKLKRGFDGGDVKIKLNYQVCNDQSCQPADSLVTSVKIPAMKPATRFNRNELFDEPVLLKVGDDPLNKTAKQMYPSPAIFDVDNDGQNELVVGDIFGSLFVYEDISDSSTGDPVWNKPTKLNSADGKPIKVKNW